MSTEITTIKLNFESNIDKNAVNNTENLINVLTKLEKTTVNDALPNYLSKVSQSLKGFKGATVGVNLGRGINNLVENVNKISEVKDISPFAKNLEKSFESVSKAIKSFEGNKGNIPANLGRGVKGLVEATNEITRVRDISPFAIALDTNFKELSKITRHFTNFNANIPVNLGRGISNLLNATNEITNVKDISHHSKTLETNFKAVAVAASAFSGFNARIPAGLGRAITGLIESSNSITEVKDISQHAFQLKVNFANIAAALRSFEGIDAKVPTGLPKLLESMSNIDQIKPIDAVVVKNAEMLAKAINALDKDVTVSGPRLRELANTVSVVGRNFNTSRGGVDNFGGSLSRLNFAATIYGLQRITGLLKGLMRQAYSTVSAYGEVENTMSFFSQSLGEQSKGVANVIQQYADLGIVDFTEFADQVAKLNQIYQGYGIAAEDASKMALNMTQVAYDASYALGKNGKDIALWNQRALSVATGQTRAGYYFGVDTSVKALQQEFTELTSQTDKATMSQAAYTAVIENTKNIQGQLVREMDSTYVQMSVLDNKVRQLKQSIGQMLAPAFKSIINWALIGIKVIEKLIDLVVKLFGGKGFKVLDYGSMVEDISTSTGGVAKGTEDIAKGMKSANKAAKELRKTISGIDQVFTIDDSKPSDPSGGGIGGAGGVIGSGGDLPGYDWLDDEIWKENEKAMKALEDQADALFEKIVEAVPDIIAIGAAFAAWKISKKLLNNLKWISELKDVFGGLGLDKLSFGAGFALFLADFDKLRGYIEDLLDPNTENGLYTISGIITSFIGIIGDFALMTGNIKLAGALKFVQGVGDIFVGIKDIIDNGPNWDNVSRALDGLSNMIIAIGLIKGDWKTVGVGLGFQGLIIIVNELKDLYNAIKTGEWEDFSAITLFTGFVLVVAGLFAAFKKFEDIKEATGGKDTIPKVTGSVGELSDGVGQVSGKMQSLVKNVGLGVVVLAEVAAGAVIFVAAIWAVSVMLGKIVEEWKPIIAEGSTAAIAIASGTAILVGVGLAANALGTGGPALMLNMAMGTAVLVEVGIAALIFVGEIWLIGKALQKVIDAWSPVLANGDTAVSAIALGTGLLVGVGLVTGALGVATAGTFGLLPLAIGLGTAMLVGITAATITFINELAKIATQLINVLAPEMTALNAVMPELSSGTEDFTKYMVQFATAMAAYAGSSVVSGISGTISTIVGWFTKDPIKQMADDAKKNKKQFTSLNTELSSVNPLVRKGINLMNTYISLLDELQGIAEKGASIGSMPRVSSDFKIFSKDLKDGFADLDKVKTQNVAKIMQALSSLDLNKFKGMGKEIVKSLELGMTTYNFNLTSVVNKIKTGLTFSATSIGTGIANDLVRGINNSSVNLNSFSNKIKNGLKFNATSIGSNMASEVSRGINSGSVSISSFTNRIKSNLNVSTYSIGRDIAWGVQNGINNFYPNLTTFTNRLKRGMKVSFEVKSPSRWAKREIGAMLGEGINIGVNETDVDFNPFKRNVEAGLSGMNSDFIIQPEFEMPTLDRRGMTTEFESMTKDMNAKVRTSIVVDNDNTEQAVEKLTDVTVMLLSEVVEAVKEGRDVYIDGKKMTDNIKANIRNEVVKSNRSF